MFSSIQIDDINLEDRGAGPCRASGFASAFFSHRLGHESAAEPNIEKGSANSAWDSGRQRCTQSIWTRLDTVPNVAFRPPYESEQESTMCQRGFVWTRDMSWLQLDSTCSKNNDLLSLTSQRWERHYSVLCIPKFSSKPFSWFRNRS